MFRRAEHVGDEPTFAGLTRITKWLGPTGRIKCALGTVSIEEWLISECLRIAAVPGREARVVSHGDWMALYTN